VDLSFVEYLEAQPDVDIVYYQFDPARESMGMVMRFLVAADPTIDVFLVRDLDSRLSLRERYGMRFKICSLFRRATGGPSRMCGTS
jgi:hypothetical protein